MKSYLIFQILLLTQILSAQSFYEAMGTPFEAVQQSAIAFADIDGDTDLDVLITGRNEVGDYVSKLYTNDGMGNFTELIGTPFEGYSISSFAFADVDGDNDKDVIISGSTSQKVQTIYINNGTGNFTESTGTPFEPVDSDFISFADVDGDSDLDVLIAGRNMSGIVIPKLYTNDGLGNFSEVMGTSFEGTFLVSPAFADVDGDNDLDLLITGRNNFGEPLSKMYLNDGMGNFSATISLPFENIRTISAAFADVDHDNDQDVLITGSINSGLDVSALYSNDGLGNFTEVIGTPFAGVSKNSTVFADVDGDNDQDLLITGRPNNGIWISKLYTNDGTGDFSEVFNTPFDGVESGSVAFADVDGDNDQDVLITGLGNSGDPIAKLYINDRTSSNDDLTFGLNLDFTIYPNPVEGNNLNLSYYSEQNGILTINMTDLDGNIITRTQEFVSHGQQTISVDITSLIQGSYFIELNDGKKRGITKFIVI